jgi:hypothetical protein
LISNGKTNISELISDRYDFGDLRLHRLRVAEGEGEEAFKEGMLAEVIIALVVDSKEVPNLL